MLGKQASDCIERYVVGPTVLCCVVLCRVFSSRFVLLTRFGVYVTHGATQGGHMEQMVILTASSSSKVSNLQKHRNRDMMQRRRQDSRFPLPPSFATAQAR